MQSLIRLFRYLQPYAGHLVLAFGLLLISTAFGLAQPKLIEYAIDSGIRLGDAATVWRSALLIFVSALLSAGLSLASGFALIRSSQGFGYQVRNALFRQLMAFSFANLDRWRTGELMVRLNSDVNTVRNFIRMGSFMIVQSILMIIGTLIAMFLTDAGLAGIMAIVMPLTMVVFFLVATKIRPLFMKARKAVDELNNVIQENLAGAKLVRAFNREEEEKRKFELRNQSNYKVSMEVGVRISIIFPVFFLIANGAVLITLWVGGVSLLTPGGGPISSGLTLGKLVAFNNYAAMAMFPLMMLGMVLNFISMAIASASRIEEVLQEKPTISDPENPREFTGIGKGIEFRDVSFRYGTGEKALDGISLQILSGEKFGIIGTTGGGKTSLVNLIGRFYDPESGLVLVNGQDVRDYRLADLRQNIAMVQQETVLFSGSLRHNLAFGAPGASQAELERAAEIADASEFISAKTQGWDELVGERGVGLSGGQRQRVAIARAIATKPEVIILDDVTSALDAPTERKIIAALYKEFADRTCIIISQKVNSIRNADRIALMEDGRIEALGSHAELLATSPTYRIICETQGVMP